MSKENKIFIFGHHAVEGAIDAGMRKIYEVFCTAQNAERYEDYGYSVKIVDKNFFEKRAQGQTHQGVGAAVSPLKEKSLKDILKTDPQLILMLDQVTDPHNVGACLRSANAFGASALIIPERASAKDSPIIAKTSVGALEYTPIVVAKNLNKSIEELQKAGFWVVGLDGYADKELSEIDLKGKVCIVMGSEGKGLRKLIKENCDFTAKLPMVGQVESLNVSVATGISLYEVAKQNK